MATHERSSRSHSEDTMSEDYYAETLVRSIDEGITENLKKHNSKLEFPIDIVHIIAHDTLLFNEKDSVNKIQAAWLKYKKERCEECGTMRSTRDLNDVAGCFQITMYCCWKRVCKTACVMKCEKCKKKQNVQRIHFEFDGDNVFECVECKKSNRIDVYQNPKTCAFNPREDYIY